MLITYIFFTCDLIDKRDEIISNEFINKFPQQMQDIINYACGFDLGCVFSLYREYVSKLNSDEYNQYREFINSPDCEDTCFNYILVNIHPDSGFIASYFWVNMCDEHIK